MDFVQNPLRTTMPLCDEDIYNYTQLFSHGSQPLKPILGVTEISRKKYYVRGRRRSKNEKNRGNEPYAFYRMRGYIFMITKRAHGKPVDIHQGQMARYFITKGGPSYATIKRHWKAFMKNMEEKWSFLFTRRHDHSKTLVSRKLSKNRKLIWTVQDKKMIKYDGTLLFLSSHKGGNFQYRWLRDRNGSLIVPIYSSIINFLESYSQKLTFKNHYLNFDLSSVIFSFREQQKKENQRQTDAECQEISDNNTQKPREIASLKVPTRILRYCWFIVRPRLGNQGSGIVGRACKLWAAGYPRKKLFHFLDTSMRWVPDIRTGNRGAIAAGVLASLVMGKKQHVRTTKTEFNNWIERNKTNWVTAAISNVIAYENNAAVLMGFQDRDKVRAAIRASLGIN